MLGLSSPGPDMSHTRQTPQLNLQLNLRHRKPGLSVRWWPRRESWWWSPRRSRGRWRTPSGPRPRAAWSRSRWGRPPRPGCRTPLVRAESRAGNMRNSQFYLLLFRSSVVQLSHQAGERRVWLALVVSVSRSQPMISSIRWDARISRTANINTVTGHWAASWDVDEIRNDFYSTRDASVLLSTYRGMWSMRRSYRWT